MKSGGKGFVLLVDTVVCLEKDNAIRRGIKESIYAKN